MYKVMFYKWAFFGGEWVTVEVKANSHENALRNARRKGYLLKDGWKWYSSMRLGN